MHQKLKKVCIFEKIDQKIRFEISERSVFLKFFFAFQVVVENFLRIRWAYLRYLEGAPRSYLYAGTKLEPNDTSIGKYAPKGKKIWIFEKIDQKIIFEISGKSAFLKRILKW